MTEKSARKQQFNLLTSIAMKQAATNRFRETISKAANSAEIMSIIFKEVEHSIPIE